MTTLSLESLLSKETKESIYETALEIARDLSLPVSSWQPGDPTRSLYHLEAEILEAVETIVSGFIRSAFKDYAAEDWLTVLADQVYGITRTAATYASGSVTLTNARGAVYTIEAGDLTVSSSLSGTTYHNTSGGTLSALGTLALDFVADTVGSDGSAGATEIDTMVTTLLGVTCSNAAAFVGIDAQSDESLREQCEAFRGSLSPNGPAEAYDYVARSTELTGVSGVRSRVFEDSTSGEVTTYLAGPSGPLSADNRNAIEEAIVTYAVPLGITPTVLNATAVTQAITYEVWVYASVNEEEATIEAAIETALETMVTARKIGGDIIPPASSGYLYRSLIESTIRGVYPNHTFRVSVSLPASDLALANNEVAVLGTVTGTVHLVTE